MKDQIKNNIHRVKQNDNDSEGLREMYALFHQPEKEFELKEVLYEELVNAEPVVAENVDFKRLFIKLWNRIELNSTKSETNLISISTLLKIAAILLIGIVLGVLVQPLLKNQEPVYYVAHAPKGSVSEVVLPDSTVIFLNADSKITYSLNGENGNREVYLEGEAWFNVEKNDRQPFLVHTGFYNVLVTGTQFDIKAYPADNEVITTLEEGRVVIKNTDNFKLTEELVLKPGEQVVLNKTSRALNVKSVNTKWYTSWKDNKLIFVNTSLKDLEILLERKYGVEIEIKNSDLLDLHFDGTIKNESIIEILEIIKKTLPINYQIAGQKIEITKSIKGK